jgi:hypothetical protein
LTTRERFEKTITKWCKTPNINGYFLNNSENLIEGIDLNLFQHDLMQGSGNELKSKFNAVYSSSALGVNNFAIVKRHLHKFEFLGKSNFIKAEFERQFRTGLGGTPPNLDFTIENSVTIIAFESKYLEPLDKKKAKFTESYKKEKLNYLDSFWFYLIDKYQNTSSYLDVAQLIKHSIGLINHKKSFPKIEKIILVYIYWTPDNFADFAEYNQHEKELIEFKNEIGKSKDLDFVSLTYNQFWDTYDNTVFKEHFEKMKNRYKIKI